MLRFIFMKCMNIKDKEKKFWEEGRVGCVCLGWGLFIYKGMLISNFEC